LKGGVRYLGKTFRKLADILKVFNKNLNKGVEMKKSLIWLIVVIFAVTIGFTGVGCKKEAAVEEKVPAEEEEIAEEEVAEEEAPAEEEQITLSFFTQEPGAYPELLPMIIEKFEEKYPNVTVDKRAVGYGEYQSTLVTMIAAGEAPDVFLVELGAPYVAQVKAGELVNLDEYLEADDGAWAKTMAEGARILAQVDGSQYCTVYTMGNIHFFINKGLMEEMELSEPKTTDDLISMAEKLSGTGIAPLCMGIADKWGAVDLFVALVWQQGGEDILYKADAGEASWVDPLFVGVMDTIKEMVNAGVYFEGATAMAYHEDALPIWIQGNTICLYPAGNFIIDSIPEEMDVLVRNFPVKPGGKSLLTGGTAYTVGISTQSKHIDLAVEFLKEFNTQFAYEQSVLKGVSPAGKIEKDIKSPSPIADAINAVAGDAVDRRIYTPELYDAIAVAVQGVFAGDLSPEEAMEQIQKVSDEVY